MLTNAQQAIDTTDKEILNEIQWTFPLTSLPFDEIGSKYGISGTEVKERVTRLKKNGIIRQLSAIFDTRRLGYKSSLVAMEIEPDKLEYVASQINRHPGVSHNYERDHKFNLWFTLAVPPNSNLKDEIEKFSKLSGIKNVRMLPTIKLFKIGVKLEMVDDKKHEVAPTEKRKDVKNVPFIATARDKEFIRELQKDIDIEDRPFLKIANKLGISEDDLFKQMAYYEKLGVLRRFAAILRHRQAGFLANGMIVWKVPEDRIEEVGSQLGSFPQVSHCYQRPTYPDWPYNVFSMVHCKSKEDASEMAKKIQDHIKVDDYKILFSLREFKKTRVEYFVEHKFELEETISTRT